MVHPKASFPVSDRRGRRSDQKCEEFSLSQSSTPNAKLIVHRNVLDSYYAKQDRIVLLQSIGGWGVRFRQPRLSYEKVVSGRYANISIITILQVDIDTFWQSKTTMWGVPNAEIISRFNRKNPSYTNLWHFVDILLKNRDICLTFRWHFLYITPKWLWKRENYSDDKTCSNRQLKALSMRRGSSTSTRRWSTRACLVVAPPKPFSLLALAASSWREDRLPLCNGLR